MESPLPLIYIAGPFRGPTPLDVRRNVERARDLALRVAAAGGFPITPHLNTAEFDKQLVDEFWLQGDLVLLNRCDAMVLTENWEQSTGATAERAYAESLSLPIYEWTKYSVADPRKPLLPEFIASVRVRFHMNGAIT